MNFKMFFSIRLIVGMFLMAVFLTAFYHFFKFKEFIDNPVNLSNSQILNVKSGQGVASLARELEDSGLISNSFYLRLYIKLNPKLSSIKVGEYQLTPGDTPITLLERLNEGKVIQYSFTIVEGMTFHQVMEKLSANSDLKHDWPIEEKELAESLNLPHEKIEGWLLPDTYFFTRDSSGLALLKRATTAMQNELSKAWNQREDNLPYTSAYDALIMASIVEKETGLKEERAMIAGVFVKRLRMKMRLQTDPTVIYGIGPDFNGDITYKDLRTPTAYNTYVIKGLPPTPIAMPGREAIHATLNPVVGDWLYFVATGDGGHKFSETLEQHNIALRAYLKRLRKQK